MTQPAVKRKFTFEIEAIDIPTMQDMSLEDYKDHIEGSLMFVDHHGILRSSVAEYPLATTKEQFDALLNYLQAIRPKIEQ